MTIDHAGRALHAALAYDIIDNNGDLDALNVVVEKLHRHCLELAVSSPTTNHGINGR
ncbi:MAG TPA: hypothetical protein VFJ01_12130 [Oleiagrimonas sp.]|nr:hypothetical protein [Oleiagrimonas sp.]